jgi:putative ABC transport system permease protein
VYLPGAALRPGEADQFAATLLQRLRAVPGVQFAGAGWMAPFARSTCASTFTIGRAGRQPVTARSLVNVVTPGYAEALRLQLRAGRLLTDADLSSARQSLVVNEEFVRTFLSNSDPVGFNVGVILSRGVEAEIVGVVRNVLKEGLHDLPQPEVHLVAAHRYTVGGEIKLVVRTPSDPLATARTVQQLVASFAPTRRSTMCCHFRHSSQIRCERKDWLPPLLGPSRCFR